MIVPGLRAWCVAPVAVTLSEFPQLSLSASAWREVAQDRVAVTLYASHESPEPGPAQARVNEQLNPVLARLKERKDLEVQSAGYRSDPVWKDSRVVAWRARGAIRLTAAPSEDFNRLVGELASSLSVESVSYFLGREARIAVGCDGIEPVRVPHDLLRSRPEGRRERADPRLDERDPAAGDEFMCEACQ